MDRTLGGLGREGVMLRQEHSQCGVGRGGLLSGFAGYTSLRWDHDPSPAQGQPAVIGGHPKIAIFQPNPCSPEKG